MKVKKFFRASRGLISATRLYALSGSYMHCRRQCI